MAIDAPGAAAAGIAADAECSTAAMSAAALFLPPCRSEGRAAAGAAADGAAEAEGTGCNEGAGGEGGGRRGGLGGPSRGAVAGGASHGLAGGVNSAAGSNAKPRLCHTHAASPSWPAKRSSPRRSSVLTHHSAAGSSAGPGRAVSHADASDPAQLCKRARSARAVDCACEEAPFASTSSAEKGAAVRESASA